MNKVINSVDLKEGQEEKPKKEKKKRKIIFKLFLFLFVFVFVGVYIFSSQVTVSDETSSSWLYKIPFVGQIKHLVESADRELKGEKNDRINILLLGMGGKKHEGGYLTDTIILTSLEPSTKKVSMISIPRDMAVPIENMGYKKINHINAFAEVKNPGSGGLAISQAIKDILNIPIDYYLRVDFEGFVNIINELGGVEVDVDNTFDDYSYPIMGMEEAEPYESRYEHLHFDEGVTKMDGETALKFARSRHALGVEGSDFARARRQQKIIEAVKNEIFSSYTLFKPKMIYDILEEVGDHISTNLKIWEVVKLWDMFKDINSDQITNRVLDSSPQGLLVDDYTEEGAYVLLPRYGDYSEIQYLVNNLFSDAPKEYKNKVMQEEATIEVRNGTWVNGLASQVAVDIEALGFNVIRIGNSSQQNFQKSVIYDLSYGEKIESLNILKNKTKANVSYTLPEWLKNDIAYELSNINNPEQPDFVLILGQDADKSNSGIENEVE